MDAPRQPVRDEQVPELAELVERPAGAERPQPGGGCVEDLTVPAKRREPEQQGALHLADGGVLESRLDSDEVSVAQRAEDTFLGRLVEPGALEQPGKEVGVADIDLDGRHAGAAEGVGSQADALGVGPHPRRPDQLAASLERLPSPPAEQWLVAQHRAEVAEPQRERPLAQLSGHHPGDTDSPLPDQGEQRPVGVHEPKKLSLLPRPHPRRDGVDRLHQRGRDQPIPPRLERPQQGVAARPLEASVMG